MPRPQLRSRSLKRVKKKLPGGAFVTHYSKRRPSGAKCAKCKAPLRGVPRVLDSKMKKLGKTEKRPERAYGGYLCSSCLRGKIKNDLMK